MEPLIENFFVFGLILTRVCVFVVVLPLFGSPSIPVQIKAAICLIVAVFLAAVVPLNISPADITPVQAAILLGNEAIYGAAAGVSIALVFAAVRLAGIIIENQIGFNMAEILDPLSGEETQPASMLLEMVFILLFLAGGGHHLFLLVLDRSYDFFVCGRTADAAAIVQGITHSGSIMFAAALRLSAPILAAFILLMIVLAILARVVPEMDILFISLPLRVALGIAMMTVFVPFLREFVEEFGQWMSKLLAV